MAAEQKKLCSKDLRVNRPNKGAQSVKTRVLVFGCLVLFFSLTKQKIF